MEGLPITPAQLTARQIKTIPPAVFDIFNDLIETGWSNESNAAIFSKDIVITRIVKACPNLTLGAVDNGYFLESVLRIYIDMGWNIGSFFANKHDPGSLVYKITKSRK
jgi:hypothetical protein